MQNASRIVAIAFLAFLAGAAAMYKRMPPLPQLLEAYYYLAAPEASNEVTGWEKIQNDTNVYPYRHLWDYTERSTEDANYSEVALISPRSRRIAPLVSVDSENREPGLTLINALLDTESYLQGIVLLGENGEVLHQWPLTQDFVEWEHRPDTNVFYHGFEVFPDGSIIAAINMGSSVARIDQCGNPIWVKEIGTHHSVTADGPDHVWTWDHDDMIRMRIEDGEIVKRVSLSDVIAANPDTDILAVRQRDGSRSSRWDADPMHANDVDPLPAALASAFPMFSAGDLAISFRSLNSIVVIDPESARIKWWRQGVSRRQHDPDWLPSGQIMYYDNNTNRGKSRIRTIDPADFSVRDIIDGNDYDFYSGRQGVQQKRPGGSILITSTYQGRVFEVNPDGSVVFEFRNRYDDGHVGYVGGAMTVPIEFFKEIPRCD